MELLSGNEAIAQGAWEAGARIGVAYPGTPSTETMEAFAAKSDVYAEWCPNEKVAVEVGLGASAAGARVIATMKHVGVNVAADPLFTAAYTGVGGGYVILAADDPGMHSSQNEQDSRFYGRAAHIPVLEPSDSSEALHFAKHAFDISETFDIPVLIRSTVRISHSRTPVDVGCREEHELIPYKKNPAKWVMMPAFAKPRRRDLDQRIKRLKTWVEDTPLNRIENYDSDCGIICSGAIYQYVRDALPHASVFKLGVTWPLPVESLKRFAQSISHCYVIDEASEYLSEQIHAAGIPIDTLPHPLPADGELTPMTIRKSFGEEDMPHCDAATDLPPRPPALCAGCPHRGVFRELTRLHAIVTGDIGCYTLGALPPLSGMDTTVDMGASVSMAHGFELALHDSEHRPIVGVIGDSTFGHSGLSSLLNTAYNRGAGTIAILDNRTTAMTGHQGNPFNGITLQKRPSREMDLVALVKALGIEDVVTVDPLDVHATRTALKQATTNDDLSVVIFRSPCVLLKKSFIRKAPYVVNSSCTACHACVSIGCPALECDSESGNVTISAVQCVGCGLCSQYCAFDAIHQVEEASK
ncbi:MAG: thiamine pyrophosphate-dependent enzyme [Eggerthellaceae bacterium]|jgi:indolepyruvate ferredoxin oxidoreductase alpha subunit|nr:thiamine pyrophosphate-dependent enzyme [Eggerthellaceae bacterium]MCH4220595.1 thiamine pyrophosphate-dependent enzyme [Eggerthellaceae bacterium]